MTGTRHQQHRSAGNGRHRRNSEIDSIKESVSQLRQDVMQVVESTVDAGKARANDAMSEVSSRLTDIKDRGNDQLGNIGKSIAERPLTSAAIAVGIGFILAKLLGHR